MVGFWFHFLSSSCEEKCRSRREVKGKGGSQLSRRAPFQAKDKRTLGEERVGRCHSWCITQCAQEQGRTATTLIWIASHATGHGTPQGLWTPEPELPKLEEECPPVSSSLTAEKWHFLQLWMEAATQQTAAAESICQPSSGFASLTTC